MAVRTISNSGGNWADVGAWVEGAVPTSADDVVATGTSGNLTLAASGSCRSIDLSGYTATFTHDASRTLSVGDASGGSLNFTGSWTYIRVSTTTSGVSFVSTSDNGGAGWAITTAGKALAGVTFNGAGGKWVLQDALSLGNNLTLTTGSLDTNNQTVNVAGQLGSAGSNVRSLTLGTSTVNVSGLFNPWALGGSNLTFSGASSTITHNVVGAGTFIRFNGAGFTYGTVIFDSSGLSGNITREIRDSNTFGTLKIRSSDSGTNIMKFFAGTTQTVGTWDVAGNAAAVLSLESTTAGSSWTIAAAEDAVSPYVAVKDSTITGATFGAAPGGVDNGNNSGWTWGGASGSSAGISTAIGDLDVLEGSMFGRSEATSTAAGDLGLGLGLGALPASGRSTVPDADLLVGEGLELQGRAAGAGAVEGDLSMGRALSGVSRGRAATSAELTMPTYSFTPPVAFDNPSVLPGTRGPAYRLFRHYGPYPRGRSVVRVDGDYRTVDLPSQELIAGLEEGVDFFLGGHEYVVSKEVAVLLQGDGYDVPELED